MDLKKGKKIRLFVESINSQGDGVARLGEERFVFFVQGALPGEEVEGYIKILKKHYGVVKLTSIFTSSPYRTTPSCPWYNACGGCSLQHADYSMQLGIKRRIVSDAFMKSVGIKSSHKVLKCVPSPLKWCYRNKASFPVKKSKKNLNIGFYMKGSHRIVPIGSCNIVTRDLDDLYKLLLKNISFLGIDGYDEKRGIGDLRHIVLRQTTRGDKAVILVLRRFDRKNEKKLKKSILSLSRILGEKVSFHVNLNPHRGNKIFGEKTITIAGKDSLEEVICNEVVSFGPTSFFQINRDVAELLFKEVKDLLEAEGAEQVTELYCGVGAITVTYARNVKSATVVESWPESVKFLRKNIEVNKMSNVHVLEGEVENFSANMLFGENKVIILDPPRTGCSRSVLEGINSGGPKAVIYVSCNPATLARDVATLIDGGYELAFVKPFDMFPMTAHVESLALLTRKDI